MDQFYQRRLLNKQADRAKQILRTLKDATDKLERVISPDDDYIRHGSPETLVTAIEARDRKQHLDKVHVAVELIRSLHTAFNCGQCGSITDGYKLSACFLKGHMRFCPKHHVAFSLERGNVQRCQKARLAETCDTIHRDMDFKTMPPEGGCAQQ